MPDLLRRGRGLQRQPSATFPPRKMVGASSLLRVEKRSPTSPLLTILGGIPRYEKGMPHFLFTGTVTGKWFHPSKFMIFYMKKSLGGISPTNLGRFLRQHKMLKLWEMTMTKIPKLFMRVVGKVVAGHLEVRQMVQFFKSWWWLC